VPLGAVTMPIPRDLAITTPERRERTPAPPFSTMIRHYFIPFWSALRMELNKSLRIYSHLKKILFRSKERKSCLTVLSQFRDKKEKKISIVSKGTDTATNSLEVSWKERYTLRIV